MDSVAMQLPKGVAAAAVEVGHWNQQEPAAKWGEDGLKM